MVGTPVVLEAFLKGKHSVLLHGVDFSFEHSKQKRHFLDLGLFLVDSQHHLVAIEPFVSLGLKNHKEAIISLCPDSVHSSDNLDVLDKALETASVNAVTDFDLLHAGQELNLGDHVALAAEHEERF